MTKRSCKILVLGHLPSTDNLQRLRARDVGVDPETLAAWRTNVTGCLGLLRCFGTLISITYCPTSLRNLQSAQLLTEVLGIAAPHADRRLNTIDYGVYKGRPVLETPSRAGARHVPYEGGESWDDVVERWRDFCKAVLRQHEDKIVLLAGQSATAVRMLRHFCEHVPLERALDDPVPNIPFFSSRVDFPTTNLVWHYSWNED